MEKKMGFQKNWSLRIAGILFYLVVVSTWMLSGLFARYTSSDTGMDETRTAQFDILSELSNLTENIAVEVEPGNSMTYELTVENKSEVGVSLIPTFQSMGTLPLNISISLEDEEEVISWNVLENAEYTIDGKIDENNVLARSYKPGEQRTYSIIVAWDDTVEGNDSSKYAGNVSSIQLSLKVEQTD